MKTNTPNQVRFLIAFLALAGIASVLWAITHYTGAPIDSRILAVSRWIALAAFCGYAWFRRSLTTWIMFGILLGAEFGHDLPEQAKQLQVLSAIFLRLIRTIIAPLIFSTLVVGIAGHSNLKQVGRMGIKALLYFEIVTTIALFIGLGAINLSRAGVGVKQPANTPAVSGVQKQSASDLILHVFPENIAKSVAENQVLQVVVFSIIFGIALAMLDDKRRRPMLEFAESFSETMFKFTNIVMLFAPIGVAGAIAFTVSTMGFEVIWNLAKLVLTLYAALIVFVCCVFVPVALIARIDLRRFLKAVAEPASIAFATASSEAALPRAMEAMEAFGVPRQVVAFVIPTGYTFNMDGSTLYLSLASIFVAQAAGIHLTLSQQLVMVITLMLTSKGTAGVPRATLVILLATADSFQLPAWPIFAVLGVDQIMDMARTMVNVVGNCLASAVVARWEGELNTETPKPAVADAMAQ
jgi:proton glutamate symport protein